MSIRYTLRLETDGAEVWKRWTGDREEVIRLALPALVELEVPEEIARVFLLSADASVVANMMPDSFSVIDAFSKDLSTRLTLDVRKSQGVVTQATQDG